MNSERFPKCGGKVWEGKVAGMRVRHYCFFIVSLGGQVVKLSGGESFIGES